MRDCCIMSIDDDTFLEYCTDTDFEYQVREGDRVRIVFQDGNVLVGKILFFIVDKDMMAVFRDGSVPDFDGPIHVACNDIMDIHIVDD